MRRNMLALHAMRFGFAENIWLTCRSEEVCGRDSDSVTKLHVDLSDAINITLHVGRCATEPGPHIRCGSEVADTSKDPT